jgi:hypothetical protein
MEIDEKILNRVRIERDKFEQMDNPEKITFAEYQNYMMLHQLEDVKERLLVLVEELIRIK